MSDPLRRVIALDAGLRLPCTRTAPDASMKSSAGIGGPDAVLTAVPPLTVHPCQSPH